ncbi:hypothetical protein GR160_14730 [Flavobacterium sp. Sd200]|uniref:hypothetical protein n=1 Tax=Flavobacterium sp. Sd200 TaxID=2692211 RepID=UPI00136BBD12|nr:hypothetical protein [Flavobacterium sp. Sd200]MXN92482.1 hypothetical protein [Flavobacterium sp. Sd200]
MKYIFLFLFIVFCSCKNNSVESLEVPEIPSDSLTLAVFNDVITSPEVREEFNFRQYQDTVYVSQELTNESDLDLVLMKINYKQAFFSKTDSLYFNEQKKNLQHLNITDKQLKEKRVVLFDDKLMEVKQAAFKDSAFDFNYYKFSKPLISADHTKAIIQVRYSCLGCGFGIALIFEKKSEKWILIDQLSLWDN